MTAVPELLKSGLRASADAISSGALNPLELVDVLAQWHETVQPALNTWITVDFDRARDTLKRGEPLGEKPLAGVPLGLKDNLHVDGFPTTCASRMLATYRPPFDATVTARLRNAGAVFYGKLNMDEFAMGSSNETSWFGPVRNPWDTARVPGGSSGGSAAAVASRSVIATLGSDTGGSIRQPAALCGITGLKPTYGRVSRWGLVAFSSSLDQIGPMATSAEDCELLLSIIAGKDPRDATSVDHPVPPFRPQPDRPSDLRIGIPQEYMSDAVAPSIRARLDAFRDWAERELGATVTSVSLPHTPYAIATYYVLTSAEASSNLARYDGIRYGHRADAGDLASVYTQSRSEGFGAEVKRRIMLGTFTLSSGYYDAYYARAQRIRTLMRQDMERAFGDVDVLLTPTTPSTAFALGEKLDDPLQMYLND
ncbi:MAG: Asp-tRNA(Asn)/Glu-tRNA(Gln) amidotransferase subunit GatA, partial [Candidatus Dadabacteria bacterium]